MKIRTFIITLGLIVTMISGIKQNYFDSINDEKNINTATNEEIVIEDENVISEENKTELKQENTISDEIKEMPNKTETNHVESVKNQIEKNTEMPSQTPTVQNETVNKNTEETTQKPKKNESVVINPPLKEEIQPEKTITPSDLEYWCVGGGSHHVAGDGAEEHGYYASWDEANNAFEEYTKGWASVQFKIIQCPCGLYYFWAIQ